MTIRSTFFFGDSICFGQYVSPHLTWVGLISEYLWERGILVQNPSINGDITRNALLRMPHDIQEQDVDVLYVQFGLNDCNHWESDNGVPRVDINAFEGNMIEIVERARASGVKEVLLATNHPVAKLSESPSYNMVIREVADRYETGLVDHEDYWKGMSSPDDFLLDGIHLNHKGHLVYYDRVGQCLRGLL